MKIQTTTTNLVKTTSRLIGERVHIIVDEHGNASLMSNTDGWATVTQAPLVTTQVTDPEDGWSIELSLFKTYVGALPATGEGRHLPCTITTQADGLTVRHKKIDGKYSQMKFNMRVCESVGVSPSPVSFDRSTTIELPDLRKDLRAAVACTDETRPTTAGVNLEISDGTIRLGAANGIRLYEARWTTDTEREYHVHLPYESLNAVLKFQFERALIDTESHNWCLEPSNELEEPIYVAMQPLSTPHIDYNALLAKVKEAGKGFYTRIKNVDGDKFYSSTRTARVFARYTRAKTVQLTARDGLLSLYSTDGEGGWVKSAIDIDDKTADALVVVSSPHLSALTSALAKDEVTLQIHQQLPLIVQWGQRTAMLMQMEPPEDKEDESDTNPETGTDEDI